MLGAGPVVRLMSWRRKWPWSFRCQTRRVETWPWQRIVTRKAQTQVSEDFYSLWLLRILWGHCGSCTSTCLNS